MKNMIKSILITSFMSAGAFAMTDDEGQRKRIDRIEIRTDTKPQERYNASNRETLHNSKVDRKTKGWIHKKNKTGY